tara:strand:+ start:4434 stop:4817 length:384 start_codon:yes stop_codon:yes gene_type:complete
MSSHKYEKFIYAKRVSYAYLEVPVSFLTQVMPTDADDASIYDIGGNVVSTRTLDEYTLGKVYSLDNTKVIITLGASDMSNSRRRSVNFDDLQDWETWLDTKGYTIDKWLTVAEKTTLVGTSDYSEAE